MSYRHRLTGPLGRRVLLTLGVVAAWAGWALAPTWPLREWATVSREPADWHCRLSPDRTRLACLTYREHNYRAKTYCEYGPVRLWDLATGRERLNIPGVDPDVNKWSFPITMRLAPDGSWLLTGQTLPRPRESRPNDYRLQLWDTESGQQRWSAVIGNSGPSNLPPNFVVSPDGRFIACARGGNSTGTDVLLSTTGQVHRTLAGNRPLAFSADNRTLATVNYDYEQTAAVLVLWDITTGEPRGRLTFRQPWPAAAVFSPDGRWLAVGLGTEFERESRPSVELWDLETNTRTAELDTGGWRYSGLEFTLDGSLLLALVPEGAPRVWDVTHRPPTAVDVAGSGPNRRDEFWSNYTVFASNGARFVGSGPEPGTLAFRETATPARAAVTRQRVEPTGRPEFTPDGHAIAVLHPAKSSLAPWKQAVNWLSQLVKRPTVYYADPQSEVLFFDARTADATGRLGRFAAGTRLLGFGPTGQTVWTLTYTQGEKDPASLSGNGEPWSYLDGALRVQEWAVPTGWPPPWLLAVTAVGVLLAVADWRRERRRRAVATAGEPTP
jgi:WD40 repeat protein